MSITGSSSIRPWKTSLSSWTWTSSPQSVGGPRAGESGGGSSGLPKMGQDLPDRPWLRDERDQPNVPAAVRALKRKLLPHPRHEFRPRNPRRVVRAWLLRRVIRVAAAFRAVTAGRMPAGRGLARLADVAFLPAP